MCKLEHIPSADVQSLVSDFSQEIEFKESVFEIIY